MQEKKTKKDDKQLKKEIAKKWFIPILYPIE